MLEGMPWIMTSGNLTERSDGTTKAVSPTLKN